MSNFNPLDFIANHAGMNIADAIKEAYEQGSKDAQERKRGEWINHRNDDGHNIADCDQCGEAMQWFDDDIKPNFCPNCGAEMRGERDE